MKIVMRRRALSLALALTLALTVALLLLLSGPAWAHDEPGASRTMAIILFNGSGSAPVMQSIDPVSNTHTAPLTTSVSITYDQPMSPTVVSTRTFAVHAMQTSLLSQTYGVQGGTIALTPTSALKPGELVQVSATTGTVNITGTEPLSPTVWQFRAEALGGSGRLELSNDVGPGIDTTEDLALGDLDGDGNLDLAVVNSGLSEAYLGYGDGTFGTGLKFSRRATWNAVALGDLDGDGDLDIAHCKQTGCRVCLNDGTVPFSTTCTAYGTINTNNVGLGDMDGDGDLDMVMANWGFRDSVRFNDGDGAFDTVSRFGPSSGDPSASDSVALGDLDGDSDLDVVVGYRDGTFVYLNNGDGTSLGTGTGVGPAGIWTPSVALGDVDGDGDLDIITGRYEASNLVLLNDGDGSFDTTTYPVAEVNDPTFCVALGDLDGDGDLDVVVGNLYKQNKVYLNDGDGTFDTTMYKLGPGGDGTHAVALGDVDGDGDLDAAVGNERQNVVYLNRPLIDLAINKIAMPLLVRPGETVTYTLAFENMGVLTASGVVITDIVPATFVNWAMAGNSGAAVTTTTGYTFAWTVEDLAPAESGVITLTGQAPAEQCISVVNTATIATTSADEVASNNQDVATTTVQSATAYGLALAPDRGARVAPGAVVTYSHVLTNTGNCPDTFDLAVASSQNWATMDETSIGLGADQTATLLVSVMVPAEAVSGTVDMAELTATSSGGGMSATVTDRTVVVDRWWHIYLPMIIKNH